MIVRRETFGALSSKILPKKCGRIAAIGALILFGCAGPARVKSNWRETPGILYGVRERGMHTLERHFSKALMRLYDRWYLRHAQKIASIPTLTVLVTKFENSTSLSLTPLDFETLCRQTAHVQGRFRLRCAVDKSEEEISLELENLRFDNHLHRAERDEQSICILARVQLLEESAQSGHKDPALEPQKEYRLVVSWQNPLTLAEEDAVEEPLQLASKDLGQY